MKESFTTNQGALCFRRPKLINRKQYEPVLLHDVHLIEKLGHFNCERIHERIVHAKEAGAGSYFEVIKDLTSYTKAKFLSEAENEQKFS